QQRQDRRGQVQAATTAATGLACFIFRFLRRPPEGEAMLERLAATLIEANVIVEADKARFVHAISALTVDCSGAPWGQFRQDVSEATKMVRDLP
ncbi:hypothetical protein, partial [Aquabacterium commune]|uniref:hypothetical protein n=1 Tax=Aquabacterium commune TaxID=70586 RepID=UPI001AAC8D74